MYHSSATSSFNLGPRRATLNLETEEAGRRFWDGERIANCGRQTLEGIALLAPDLFSGFPLGVHVDHAGAVDVIEAEEGGFACLFARRL